jgi:hypothetical protein
VLLVTDERGGDHPYARQPTQTDPGIHSQTVQELMAKATTRTGLKAFTTIRDKTYQTSRKVVEDFKSNMKIVFDEFLPQWNYTAKPELQVI